MEECNLCHGIVIQRNPRGSLCIKDAIKSIEEYVSISSSSVVSAFMDKFGVNIVFGEYEPFHKAVMKGVLLVNDIRYTIYPMLTDITVIGGFPFLNEKTLKSLMKNIAPVLFVYRERHELSGEYTNNFRVTLRHPEIYDLIKFWTLKSLQIPGNFPPFPIQLFCRLCRGNGHTRQQCISNRFNDEPTTKQRQQCVSKRFKAEPAPEQPKKPFIPGKDEDPGNTKAQSDLELPEKEKPNQCKKDNGKIYQPPVPSRNPDSSAPVEPNTRKQKINEKSSANFLRLTPPELHYAVPQLKKRIFHHVSNEESGKNMCKIAELYPKGINAYLQHLKTVVEYNLKDWSNRHSHERRFVIWLDSLVGKITEELSKNDTKECPSLVSRQETSNDQNESCSKSVQKSNNNNNKRISKKKRKKPCSTQLISNRSEDKKNCHSKSVKKSKYEETAKNKWDVKNFIKKEIFDETNKSCSPEQRRVTKHKEVNIKKDQENESTIQETNRPSIDQQKNDRLSSQLSQGFLDAIRCSKGILKFPELRAFLTHARGKTHARQIAKIFSTEVNQIIVQLELIVQKHYRGMKTMSHLKSKEVNWLMELIDRLKSHEKCKICQN